MGFYSASHGKFHDRGYSDIVYRINSIDIMVCCTPENSVTAITWQLSFSTTYIWRFCDKTVNRTEVNEITLFDDTQGMLQTRLSTS